MRTLSEKCQRGLREKWHSGLLIKIGGNPSLLLTDTKVNITKNNENINVIPDVFPQLINNDPVKYLSSIKTETDPEKNNHLQPITIFNIILIKKDSLSTLFDESMIGTNISLYLLFIDPESTSIDVDEMLLLFTGHLKCVSISDNYFITLSCSVGDVLVNESIPIKTLNKWDNPCLPDSSIGRSEPVLYGRFSNTDTWKEFYDLAPSILIDDFENRYLVSSHQLLAYPNTFYFYNSSLERYVKILSEIEFLNSGNASIRHDFVVTCEALFYLKQRGSQMSTQLVERYLDFIHNEESDSLTLNPGDELFLATDAIKDTGYPEYYYEGQGYGNLKLTISLGEVIDGLSGEAAKIKYYMNNSFYYIPGNEITRQDANTRKEILLDIPVNNYFESLKSMEYGIVVEPGAAVEFKDMHVKIKYLRK